MTMCSPRAPISRSSVSGSFPLVSGLLVGQDLLPGRHCRSGVCVRTAARKEVDAPVRAQPRHARFEQRAPPRGRRLRPSPQPRRACAPAAALEGLRDHPGRGALLRREVERSGAEGDAVESRTVGTTRSSGARSRYGSGGRGVRLLRVLASEVGDVWPDDVEELQAGGQPRARGAGRAARSSCRSSPPRPTSGTRRVHLLDRRDEGGRPPSRPQGLRPAPRRAGSGRGPPALRTGRG